MSVAPDELARYAHQIKLSEIGLEGQMILKNTRVLCVGAGGLASPLLLYLAAAGVGTIGIVDDDKVEVSNLQRQILYTTENIGTKKISNAKQHLTALNPHINVTMHDTRLHSTNAEDLIAQYDIVADCSDNFATRYLINDTCFQLNKPFVFASIYQFSGQCALFSRKHKMCFRCLFPALPKSQELPNCDLGGVLGVLPGLLGTIQATEILKYVLNIGESLLGRLLYIDILKMSFTTFTLSPNPECELCHHGIANDSPDEISVYELQKKLDAEENIFLLDVRTAEEHCLYNIGGTLIPLDQLLERLHELNRHDDIVVYCHLGQRSLSAALLLKKANFHSVRSLAGGLKSWQNQLS